MYEVIRVKEGDRVFSISMSSERASDMEYLSLAFHSALMRYMTDHKELRAEYNEVLKKYSEYVREDRAQGQSESFKQLYGGTIYGNN